MLETAAEEIEISDDEMDGGDDMEREDQMDLEALKHARTLRLDDFAEPDNTDKAHSAVPEPAPQVDPAAIEAQIWKQRYEEMAEKLAAMEKQRTSDSLHTPTPKKLFSSPVPKAPEELPHGGLVSPPVKASQPLVPPPPVAKEGLPKPSAAKSPPCQVSQVSPKAAPSVSCKAVPAKAPGPINGLPAPASSPPQASVDVSSTPAKAGAASAPPAPSETEIQEGEESLAEQLDLSGEEGSC